MSTMVEFVNIFLLILWAACWILGGWWLVHAAFKLQPEEEGFVGLIVGLSAEVGLVNFLARLIPLPWAAWLSALVVLLLGFILVLHQGGWYALKIKIVPGQWLTFAVLTYLFFLISRGLAIYDDYAHLPTLSIMAAGQIPPHFAYDPQVPYRYHYFVLLFGAQVMRLTGWMSWTAWDLARSFTMAPAVILGGFWAFRVTKKRLAAWIGSAGVLFISGTRWLLLLIPGSLLNKLTSQVQLIGAGAASGPTLTISLANPWPVEGQGSFQFPYAFQNGIFTSGAEAVHSVIGLMLVAVLFTLLLTATRWRNQLGILVSIILLSGIGLLDEIELPLLVAALLLVTLVTILRNHRFKLPSTLNLWWLVAAISALIVAVQGGAWTDTMVGMFDKLVGVAAPASYQTIGFQLAVPTLVSNQLGVLPLFHFGTILVALAELGPVILVLPLVGYWSWKAIRAQRWYEAILCTAAILSLALIFVQFNGSTGVRNTSRLYFFVPVCCIMAVSSVWLWASHRTAILQDVAKLLGGIVMFGGLVMLGVQMPNIKNSQFSYFISASDVKMAATYWNKLEPDTLVFDPTPSRAATIFGRPTDAGYTWYQLKPEFDELVSNPDVYKIRAAGYSYVYIDQSYWQSLPAGSQRALTQSCVVLMPQEDQPSGNNEQLRKLYDIRNCQ